MVHLSKLRKLGLALALTLAALPAAGATIPILNSDFESGPNGNQPGGVNGLRFNQLSTTNPGWDTYSSLTGWTKSGPGRIEIQNDRSSRVDAQSGDYFISLDDGSRNATISQTLTLAAGIYILSFWYSPESSNAATNEIAYNLGNVVSGRVTAGTNGATVGVWTNIYHRIAVVTPGSYTLTFSGRGTADGVGGFIDNVSLVTAVPLPAGVAGLLGGLGLLGLMRTRRSRTTG